MVNQRVSTSTSARPARKQRARAECQEDVANDAPIALLTASLEQQPFDAAAREQMIAEAAYYRAAQRGFEPGHELDDWLSAEAEVDSRWCGPVHAG